MLHNLALRRQVPFMQEDEPGDGLVAAVEPVDCEEEEAVEEDVDNRESLIQHRGVGPYCYSPRRITSVMAGADRGRDGMGAGGLGPSAPAARIYCTSTLHP
ncbi:hypothetical protein NDU88_002420 [Pleurodeles waltl]|uniref:Uncharacterized protein n=1 Tax=Pleurodeles waltl TaxID=8319 RepID=A0AAV7MAY6_PLEWA|nr:hypothetical protein NDU88_002420 [Pleurodeles waltl]